MNSSMGAIGLRNTMLGVFFSLNLSETAPEDLVKFLGGLTVVSNIY